MHISKLTANDAVVVENQEQYDAVYRVFESVAKPIFIEGFATLSENDSTVYICIFDSNLDTFSDFDGLSNFNRINFYDFIKDNQI